MNQSNKIIVGVSVLAIGGTAGYFGYKQWKKKKDLKNSFVSQLPPKNTATNLSPVNTANNTVKHTPRYTEGFPLVKGMKGKAVKLLQQNLIKAYNADLGVYGADGDFGSKTLAAVKKHLGKSSVSAMDYAALIKKAKGGFMENAMSWFRGIEESEQVYIL